MTGSRDRTTTVLFSNVRADHLVQRHHYVARWRAQKGRAVWFDTLGSRNPRLADVRRIGGSRAGQDPAALLEGVTVVKPRFVPLLGSAPVHALNRRLLEGQLRRLRVDPAESTAWVYLPHPAIVELLERQPWKRVVFDLIDDIDDMDVHPALRVGERRLLERADVVFATAEALMAKAAQVRGGDVHYVPNGVDSARFEAATAGQPANAKGGTSTGGPADARGSAPTSEPTDAGGRLPTEGPGVGAGGRLRRVLYAGAIYEWLDEDLVASVARERADLEFRIVGPQRRPLRRLAALPNVSLPGPVPAAEVPGEIAAAQLCMIPFRRGPLTEATDPLKLYEALICGRPVLATVLRQAERFRPAVRLETTPEGWLQALADLDSGEWAFDAAALRRRIEREEDWRERFARMDRVLEGGAAA